MNYIEIPIINPAARESCVSSSVFSVAGALEYQVPVQYLLLRFSFLSWQTTFRGTQGCRGGHFSLETTLRLGVQMVSLLRMLHSTGYVHRDIKPENFCVVSQGSSRTAMLWRTNENIAIRWRGSIANSACLVAYVCIICTSCGTALQQ